MKYNRDTKTTEHSAAGLVAAVAVLLFGGLSAEAQQTPVPSGSTAAVPEPPTPTPSVDEAEVAEIAGRRPGYWRGASAVRRPGYRRSPRLRPRINYYWEFQGRPGFYRPRVRPYWAERWPIYRRYGRSAYRNPWLPWQ